MRLARIQTQAGPMPVVQQGGRWHGIRDMFAKDLEFTGESFRVGEVRFLPPVVPRIVLGMAHNGADGDRDLPPRAFFKSPRTVVGDGSTVVVDDGAGQVNIEGELALVVSMTARHVAPGAGIAHVLGYTIGNDVTSVDQVALDVLQAKNGDGYTPLGPWIETDLDPSALPITVLINGAIVAESSTAGLAWSIDEQLVYLTSHLELGAGDVLLTGAPQTFAPVEPGDDVEIRIAGIGSLHNVTTSGRRRAELPTP